MTNEQVVNITLDWNDQINDLQRDMYLKFFEEKYAQFFKEGKEEESEYLIDFMMNMDTETFTSDDLNDIIDRITEE